MFQLSIDDMLSLGFTVDACIVRGARRDTQRLARLHQEGRPTQGERILAYLLEHPRCTSLDIVMSLKIMNHTARVSELRQQGFNISVTRDEVRSDVFHYELLSDLETSQE